MTTRFVYYPMLSMKKTQIDFSRAQKGQVALFFGKYIVSGECRFTAIKTKKKGGEVMFEINLIKPLP